MRPGQCVRQPSLVVGDSLQVADAAVQGALRLKVKSPRCPPSDVRDEGDEAALERALDARVRAQPHGIRSPVVLHRR